MTSGLPLKTQVVRADWAARTCKPKPMQELVPRATRALESEPPVTVVELLAIDNALKALAGGESMSPDGAFSPEINARLLVAHGNATRAAAAAPPDVRPNVQRLLATAVRAPTAAKRVMWLHRAADTLATAYSGVSACRAGCNHCCFIPVKVSATEARVLGRAVGRLPAPVETHRPVHPEGYESPCPFLQDGSCTAYEHRPAVCRTHINLDVDDLLCRLVPGQSVPVPYLDTRLFALASIQIEPEEGSWADLRQWFPTKA